MLKTARDMVRRLGFVGAFLLALTTATLSFEAQPCAPDAERTASAPVAISKAVQADTCAAQQCRDCGLACAHGCCHAQHVGVVDMAAAPLKPHGFRSPASWPEVVGAPHGAPSDLERPPRV